MKSEYFSNDLNRMGIPTEELVLERVKKYLDRDAFRIIGQDKGKDIVCPNLEKTLEVKDCTKTKIKVPVQLKKHGKLASLSVTTADYWVFYTRSKLMVIETDKLKEIVKNIEARDVKARDGDYVIKFLPITSKDATRGEGSNLQDNCIWIWDV